MAEPEDYDQRNRPHISIDLFREPAAYEYPSRNQKRKPLRDDYAVHAQMLLDQLVQAFGEQDQMDADPRLAIEGLKPGRIVEVETVAPAEGSRTNAVKIPKNLEFPTQDVVVLKTNRNENRTESALLFVPDDAREFLQERITNYGNDPGNQRRPDVDRFESIEDIRSGNVASLVTGGVDLTATDAVWWELWIRHPNALADRVAAAAQNAAIDVHADRLIFPDTTVIFVHCAAAAVVTFASYVPGAITEIRPATGTIETFLDGREGGIGQHEWVEELAARIVPPGETGSVVCTLDTGIAGAHPLIAPGLRGAWAYDDAWGIDDHHPDGGHGTPLSGLVLYGDLEPHMNGAQAIHLTHGVESMKLLPPHGFPPTQPPSYGVVTQGAVSGVEAERPDFLRSFCIATSATDFPPSRPSTWSGAIDQAASGTMLIENLTEVPASERPKRLLILATGNVSGGMAEDVLQSHPLEDPAQAWNALTIGGFTRKEQPPAPPPELNPAVPANHRSPFSRGSQSLPYDLTPIKPEVLFEAGNMLSDAAGFCSWHPAVSLLAPGSDVAVAPLVPFWATSAATGMAGNFIGQLQAALPDLWPETHRALTVDSARWPQPIRSKLIGRGAHWKTGKNATKAKRQTILREFGYGVPDIERAIQSARNDATMIAQAEIQPFTIGADGRTGVFNEMHLYDLPWPKAALEQLENEIVTMKVTLSYFIEPNLTGKAATRPETYRSFGLRFDMKRRGETEAHFRSRISASQQKDGTEADSEQSHWLLGPKAVQAGSLHCDLWRGYAVELALHDSIAVYPVGGWWKTHAGQNRVSDQARYALVISISAPGQNVDLYSEVAALVEAKEIDVLLG